MIFEPICEKPFRMLSPRRDMSIHSSSVWIVDGLVRFATFHDDPGMHERRSHVHVTGQ